MAKAEPKTVRVRVAVAVDENGQWDSLGNDDLTAQQAVDEINRDLSCSNRHLRQTYILTADLPVPVVQEVPADVEEVTDA